jgi:dihydrofolate reductase
MLQDIILLVLLSTFRTMLWGTFVGPVNIYSMKKVILDLAVTLDGFIEGPNGEIDWCIMDDDMDFDGFLSGIDTIFYGRVSYDTWGNYQPDANASAAEQSLWKNVHSKSKYVFSSQARQDERAAFISGDIEDKVAEIKKQEGKDIWLYGGAGLIRSFIDAGLIDVYRISVHPVALGAGKPLFENLQHRVNLKLIKTNVFRSGVVQLIYETAK